MVLITRKTMTPQEIFLRGVWKSVPDEDDLAWVARIAEVPLSGKPLGDYGVRVKRMRDCGLTNYEIARFAEIVGYETAFGILYHLGDSSASYEDFADEQTELAWGLFLVDEDTDAPTEAVGGLQELILSMDPSGREMRPRGFT
jgi:hypothetical protein